MKKASKFKRAAKKSRALELAIADAGEDPGSSSDAVLAFFNSHAATQKAPAADTEAVVNYLKMTRYVLQAA